MPKAPKIQKQPPLPYAALSAAYASTGQGQAGMGQRPNKFIRPLTGGSSALQSRPSLLGGM